MVKFLIIRFSSIGDIVLTTPVIRGLKQQVEDAEVHFLTKPQFENILTNNPYIDKLLTLKKDIKDTIEEINAEEYDYIIDLHNNLRTSIIKRKTNILAFSFNKLNFKKWLLVHFKINKMPDIHIVERYMETVSVFDIKDDGNGLDFYIPQLEEVNPVELHSAFKGRYMVIVVGATYFTKQIPVDKIVAIANKSGMPVCLVGGKDVEEQSLEIEKQLKVPFLNTVGKISLYKSASLIKHSYIVLTSDTGMMHIASAFKKIVLSLWGNTVPELGMYPYRADSKSKIFEVLNLRCRPCSKIGFSKCPKKHFKCMNNINNDDIVQYIKELGSE
jgi:ADP-heptose:LPS heptosyltransferase